MHYSTVVCEELLHVYFCIYMEETFSLICAKMRALNIGETFATILYMDILFVAK